MHEQWQDLIPFYVAGVLPKTDTVALEQHLQSCDVCSKSLREWHSISEGVRAEAEAWSKPLPPLALHVRNSLYTPVPQIVPALNGNHMPTRPSIPPVTLPRRQTWSVATLAASIAILLVFGGLLIYMANRLSRNPQEVEPLSVGGLSTVIPEVVTGIPTTAAPPSPTSTPTTTSAPIALNPAPTRVIILPSNTPIPPPPPTIEQPSLNTSMMSSMVDQGCMVQNNSQTPIAVLRGPGLSFTLAATLMPGTTAALTARSENGWYRVHIEGSWVGWIEASTIATIGDCDSLPVLPAATN